MCTNPKFSVCMSILSTGPRDICVIIYFHTAGAESVESADALAAGLAIDISVSWCVRSNCFCSEAADVLAAGLEIDISVRWCVRSNWFCSSSRWLCIEGIHFIKLMNAFRLIRPDVPILPECLAIFMALDNPASWQQNGDVEGIISQTFK